MLILFINKNLKRYSVYSVYFYNKLQSHSKMVRPFAFKLLRFFKFKVIALREPDGVYGGLLVIRYKKVSNFKNKIYVKKNRALKV